MSTTHPATAAPEPTMADEFPARLTFVFPAADISSVRIVPGEDTISWTSAEGTKWEAYAEDAGYIVCAPNGEYGLDEEDYALVPAADLLDVIAHGYGDARQ